MRARYLFRSALPSTCSSTAAIAISPRSAPRLRSAAPTISISSPRTFCASTLSPRCSALTTRCSTAAYAHCSASRRASMRSPSASGCARCQQVLLSGFGGVASVGGDRQYGLYGVRMSIALPMFDASARRRAAEARLEAEESRIERDVAKEQVRRQRASLALNASALRKRITLLTQAVDVARQREESTIRLVSARVRAAAEGAGAGGQPTPPQGRLPPAARGLLEITQH